MFFLGPPLDIIIDYSTPAMIEEIIEENPSDPGIEMYKTILARWKADPGAWYREAEAERQAWIAHERKKQLWWPFYR
jgi:hypothetical protein